MIYIDLKNVAEYFNGNFTVILFAVMIIDFILGTTNRLYGNSIIECCFRLIGWTTLRTFRMRHKTLTKKRGRRL